MSALYRGMCAKASTLGFDPRDQGSIPCSSAIDANSNNIWNRLLIYRTRNASTINLENFISFALFIEYLSEERTPAC